MCSRFELRPSVAQDRLSLTTDGQVRAARLKKPSAGRRQPAAFTRSSSGAPFSAIGTW
jgi:hypothetical protein